MEQEQTRKYGLKCLMKSEKDLERFNSVVDRLRETKLIIFPSSSHIFIHQSIIFTLAMMMVELVLLGSWTVLLLAALLLGLNKLLIAWTGSSKEETPARWSNSRKIKRSERKYLRPKDGFVKVSFIHHII